MNIILLVVIFCVSSVLVDCVVSTPQIVHAKQQAYTQSTEIFLRLFCYYCYWYGFLWLGRCGREDKSTDFFNWFFLERESKNLFCYKQNQISHQQNTTSRFFIKPIKIKSSTSASTNINRFFFSSSQHKHNRCV